jgi:glycosyltransferase involved in cell wall biosynthesis
MKILHLAYRHHDKPSAGHGYWLNRAFKDSCESNGIPFVIVASLLSKDPESSPILQLDHTQRSRLTFFPLKRIRHDVRALEKLIQFESNSNPILHVYEGGLREFLLLVLLCRSLNEPKAIFNFNLSDPWNTALKSRSKLSGVAWKALSRHARSISQSVIFTAETKELATLLERKLDLSLKEYPFPYLTSKRRNVARKKEFDFFVPVLGDQELLLFIAALEILRRNHDFVPRVMIQPRWSEPLSEELVLEVTKSNNVELLGGVVTKMDYESAIQKSRVVVLPYMDTSYYSLQSSSRMIDAVALGASVIVPVNTAIGRQAEENSWGLTFDSKSEVSLASALWASLRNGIRESPRVLPAAPYEAIAQLEATPLVGGQQGNHFSGALPVFIRDLILMSSLFLFSDLRSFLWGMSGILGVPLSLQKRLTRWMPRRL